MTIDTALKRNAIGTIPEREIYYSTIETIVKSRRDISVRRIYGLPSEEADRKSRIEWIREELEKFKDCPNYYMYIFDWRKFPSIPTPLSLQIVDDVFVGLVNIQQSSTGVMGQGEDICIRDQAIVQHLTLYYDAICDKCERLKFGDDINYEILER